MPKQHNQPSSPRAKISLRNCNHLVPLSDLPDLLLVQDKCMFTKCVSTWFSAASVLQSDKYVFQLPSHPKISFKGNILEWPRSVFAQYVDFAQLLAIAQKLLLLTIATKVCSQLCKSLLTKAARKSHGQWGGIYQPSGINDRLIATIPASMWGRREHFWDLGKTFIVCYLKSQGETSVV